MKKLRKICILLTACMTAVSYAACTSSESESDSGSKNSVQYNDYVGYDYNEAEDEDVAGYMEYAEDAEIFNDEEYSEIVENGFVNTVDEPTSTFSIDVDTASYTNVRRMLQNGYSTIPEDAVRIEEMINYFSYDYPAPDDNAPFSVTTELYTCPWNESHQLMLVGLQADEINLDERAPMNLVFLIDVSGSMSGDDRLGLVQKALNMLSENLNEDDRISIVTYAGYESVLLEGASGNDTARIQKVVNSLEAGGSTAGEAGIKKAYEIAEKYFIEGGNNRILLATDGDLNVGISSAEELKALVEEKRESGVYLSVLGFGEGNLKDDNLEALADNGNGNYSYIDSELEAQKVLVQEMGGTLYTVAKDVKLQLEFDAETVQSYRLIGYENRTLANEDFNNDKVDAGEIGAGHSVTALYELVMTETGSDNLMKLSMRYKEPDSDQSILKVYPITVSESSSEQITPNLAFAAAVAEYGMALRNSAYAGTSSYGDIMHLLGYTDTSDAYRTEFIELAGLAASYGLIPETSYGLTAENAEAISDADTDIVTMESAANALYDIKAYYQGNYIELPSADSFVALTEQYLDAEVIDSHVGSTIETEAQNNGIFVSIAYDGFYDEGGKQFTLQNEQAPVYIYHILILITDEEEEMVIYQKDQTKVCKLPEVLKDELLLRIG